MTLLLGLGLASCSDDYTDWETPAHTEPDSALVISGFSASAVDPIDMEEVGDASTVTAYKLNLANLPAGYTITGAELALTPTDGSARDTTTTSMATSIDAVSHAGTVATTDLTAAITKAYGTARQTRNFEGQVLLTCTNSENLSVSHINAGSINVKVTPVYPALPEYLYENGDNNGWGGNGSLVLTPSSKSDEEGIFYGAFYLPEMTYGFKFSSVFGGWPSSNPLAKGDFNLGSDGSDDGLLVNDGGSGNLNVAEPGFYWIKVDASNMTYSFTKFDHVALIGDATEGSWDTETPLAYDYDNHVWYADNVTFKDGTFKLRSDNVWDVVDFGGSLDKLQKGAGNISVSAGTYNVRVHLENTTEAKDPFIELIPVQ